MKKLALLSIAAALTASSAVAASVTLKTGGIDGNYHSVAGKSYVKEAKKQGIRMSLATSKGSGENIEEVNNSRNKAGLVQRNVLTAYQDNKEGFDNVGGIASVGMECGFVVVPAIDNVPLTLADVAGEKFAAGKKNSGTRITFDQLASVNPELATFKAKNKGGELSLGKVESGKFGGMFFVSVPDPKNPLIKEVVSNPNLAFANISKFNLGEYGEGKKPDLTHQRVPVETNMLGSKVTQRATGICTSIDIVVDEEKMPEALQVALYKAAKNVRVQKSTLFSLYNDAKNKAVDTASKFK